MTQTKFDLQFVHVDVFSESPYSGNSLPVFLGAQGLSSSDMLQMTQELRHFEAIFLERTEQADTVRAHIFDLFEELPFAGHPIIGAAAVLHEKSGSAAKKVWNFKLGSRVVKVGTEATANGFFGLLDQGKPEFLGAITEWEKIASAFSIGKKDISSELPIEVVSTGLRYLIVPIRPGVLERAKITSDISDLLRSFGAQFAVLLDEQALEVRHWNNDGIMEDVATGSAAGTIGAYRLKNRLAMGGQTFVLNQGRFVGRPSKLHVLPEGNPSDIDSVKVGGSVTIVGSGALRRPEAQS